MKMNNYEEVNEKLYNLNFAKMSRMDLDSVEKLYHALDLPNYPKVHVAGTNGKGSCVTKISAALTLSGYKCASFTSPHIYTFRERIQINGEMISKQDTARYATEIFDLAEKCELEVTFFEVITLMALKYFADQKVDVAVVEVGLGGRLDGTNCITPILSVITSISFDHEKILGDTLEKIAAEKAGIIKSKVAVVIGPCAQQKVIKEKALEKEAPIFTVEPQNFKSYDEENQAIFKMAIEHLKKDFNITDKSVQEAMLKKPPCRYEKAHFLGYDLILDMSHNEDGVSRFATQLKKEFPNRSIVTFTSMAFNHDYHKNLKVISGFSDKIYVLDIDHPRLANANDLLQAIESGAQICEVCDIAKKVQEQKKETLIVFVGSIFIMKDVYQMLGRKMDFDTFAIHDGLFKLV
ncbi:MAG: Folylpolyglutamate synthase [Chlamydiae bacterium]|nr:Folylpolyglutamate synthase [Chlamydiota bacterium]